MEEHRLSYRKVRGFFQKSVASISKRKSSVTIARPCEISERGKTRPLKVLAIDFPDLRKSTKKASQLAVPPSPRPLRELCVHSDAEEGSIAVAVVWIDFIFGSCLILATC